MGACTSGICLCYAWACGPRERKKKRKEDNTMKQRPTYSYLWTIGLLGSMAAWGCSSESDNPPPGELDGAITLQMDPAVDIASIPATAKLVVVWASAHDFVGPEASRAEIGYVADLNFDNEREQVVLLDDVVTPNEDQEHLLHCNRADEEACESSEACECAEDSLRLMQGSLLIVDPGDDDILQGEKWNLVDTPAADGDDLTFSDRGTLKGARTLFLVDNDNYDGGSILSILPFDEETRTSDIGYVEGELAPGLWMLDVNHDEGDDIGFFQSAIEVSVIEMN